MALQEYILYAGQHPAGGLRDKPPKYVPLNYFNESLLEDFMLTSILNRNADSYHTLYCLAGLSSAQHHLYPSATRRAQLRDAWEAQPGKLEVLALWRSTQYLTNDRRWTSGSCLY